LRPSWKGTRDFAETITERITGGREDWIVAGYVLFAWFRNGGGERGTPEELGKDVDGAAGVKLGFRRCEENTKNGIWWERMWWAYVGMMMV
jgi:hypothetical protein